MKALRYLSVRGTQERTDDVFRKGNLQQGPGGVDLHVGGASRAPRAEEGDALDPDGRRRHIRRTEGPRSQRLRGRRSSHQRGSEGEDGEELHDGCLSKTKVQGLELIRDRCPMRSQIRKVECQRAQQIPLSYPSCRRSTILLICPRYISPRRSVPARHTGGFPQRHRPRRMRGNILCTELDISTLRDSLVPTWPNAIPAIGRATREVEITRAV
jgi:hypothetical protein